MKCKQISSLSNTRIVYISRYIADNKPENEENKAFYAMFK